LRKAIEIAETVPVAIPPVKIALAKAHFGLAKRASTSPPRAAGRRWRTGVTGRPCWRRRGESIRRFAEFESAQRIEGPAAASDPENAAARTGLALDHR
jgi:hypothetical protein